MPGPVPPMKDQLQVLAQLLDLPGIADKSEGDAIIPTGSPIDLLAAAVGSKAGSSLVNAANKSLWLDKAAPNQVLFNEINPLPGSNRRALIFEENPRKPIYDQTYKDSVDAHWSDPDKAKLQSQFFSEADMERQFHDRKDLLYRRLINDKYEEADQVKKVLDEAKIKRKANSRKNIRLIED